MKRGWKYDDYPFSVLQRQRNEEVAQNMFMVNDDTNYSFANEFPVSPQAFPLVAPLTFSALRPQRGSSANMDHQQECHPLNYNSNEGFLTQKYATLYLDTLPDSAAGGNDL